MTAPDAQHAGVPLRQISLNTFYIADSDPTWIAMPLSDDAQKARREHLRNLFISAIRMSPSDETLDAWLAELGIGGPA